MTFIFVCVWQDLDLPDAPRIKQLDEFLEGYKLYVIIYLDTFNLDKS